MRKTRKGSQAGNGRIPSIHLELFEPNATDVYVAGSFNQWNPEATPLIALGNGKWSKELTLPAGRYEYRFVVDGHWITDPNGKETVPNPYGSANSILTIQG